MNPSALRGGDQRPRGGPAKISHNQQRAARARFRMGRRPIGRPSIKTGSRVSEIPNARTANQIPNSRKRRIAADECRSVRPAGPEPRAAGSSIAKSATAEFERCSHPSASIAWRMRELAVPRRGKQCEQGAGTQVHGAPRWDDRRWGQPSRPSPAKREVQMGRPPVQRDGNAALNGRPRYHRDAKSAAAVDPRPRISWAPGLAANGARRKRPCVKVRGERTGHRGFRHQGRTTESDKTGMHR